MFDKLLFKSQNSGDGFQHQIGCDAVTTMKSTYLHHILQPKATLRTWHQNSKEMDILVTLILIIILQCIYTSNHVTLYPLSVFNYIYQLLLNKRKKEQKTNSGIGFIF